MPEHKDDFSVSPMWRNAPVNSTPSQHLGGTNCSSLLGHLNLLSIRREELKISGFES